MHLPSVLPLWCSPGALSSTSRPLLSPGLGSPAVGVDHLPHTLGVVVVDHVVLALPHNVLVDDVYPGVDGELVRVELHDVVVLAGLQALDPDLPGDAVLDRDLVDVREVCLVADAPGQATHVKLHTGTDRLTRQAREAQQLGGDHADLSLSLMIWNMNRMDSEF